MKVISGLDKLLSTHFNLLKGKKIGILCHQASVSSHYQHIIEVMLPHHKTEDLHIGAVFGPQHGLWGHTQDNMIEWEGYPDPLTGAPVYSLYGEHRKPTKKMLENLDMIVIDLVDVGTRYYTFIWTMYLMMEACSDANIPVIVLDRPNPINGITVQGTILQDDFNSFVGLKPLPMRHGMTIGEVARYLHGEFLKEMKLTVIELSHWDRRQMFETTGSPWVMPSPNMPSPATALVYPGMCLLEGTNLSEGRGTTRPFEMFGASWIEGWDLCGALQRSEVPGVYFRPIQFLPTFHKYQDEICEGAYIHVTDPEKFNPVTVTVAIFKAIVKKYPGNFRWKEPPYEYEYEKLPIDILAGNSWLREMIEAEKSLTEIEQVMQSELERFEPLRAEYLIYQ